MWMQARDDGYGSFPRVRRGGEVSAAAQRILRFLDAWSHGTGTPVSAAFLEPLFASEGPGALERALGELCAKRYLRRSDSWHYELLPEHDRLAAAG